jgi:uncharacterized protein (DUF4213/DUF364 family)
MQRFYLKNLNGAEIKEQYQVRITKWSASLRNLSDNVNISRAWENIRESIKVSAKESLGHYELKQHKPQFDVECSKLLDKRKLAKIAVIAESKTNEWRCEVSRTFRTKVNGNI